jgi:hypothetical protein
MPAKRAAASDIAIDAGPTAQDAVSVGGDLAEWNACGCWYLRVHDGAMGIGIPYVIVSAPLGNVSMHVE